MPVYGVGSGPRATLGMRQVSLEEENPICPARLALP